MEVIAIDGQQFVKASVAARQAGYTADYVGQLARSGAIPARLIGRTWYVDVDILRTHRVEKKRAARLKAREQVKKAIAERNAASTANVEPQKVSRYEGDRAALIPEVAKQDDSRVVRSMPASTLVVPVRKDTEENEGTSPVTVQVPIKKEEVLIRMPVSHRQSRQVIAPRRRVPTQTMGHKQQPPASIPKTRTSNVVPREREMGSGKRGSIGMSPYVLLVLAVVSALFLFVFEIKNIYSPDKDGMLQGTEYVINIGTLFSIISL